MTTVDEVDYMKISLAMQQLELAKAREDAAAARVALAAAEKALAVRDVEEATARSQATLQEVARKYALLPGDEITAAPPHVIKRKAPPPAPPSGPEDAKELTPA